ncbi:MAG: hypothetical protein JW839_10995 [Candidatus Lokiarchaeota archaeon]|nr:hypothetical protein [Candidatus Lokiarchaeota archaeon]
MDTNDDQPQAPPASEFSGFFELLRVKPDPRVEKVLGGTLAHVEGKHGEPASHLKKLLGWRQPFNVVSVDSMGGRPPAGRAIIVLDEDYRPVPGTEVRSSTGESGTTDAHGRFTLHESWDGCGFSVVQGDKEGSFTIDHSPRTTDGPKEELLLYILTDLEQYRPSQPIHVRGIAWRVAAGNTTPVKGAIAVTSLVNEQLIEIVRQRRVTDEFGVFDLVIETDFMIREGAYTLRFDFPEYNHVAEKPITIENFTPPTLVIEAPPRVDGECGKDIEIHVAARYYFGDPLAGGSCTALVSGAAGTLAEAEFSTREDGTATACLPTAALGHGDYDARITARDAAGRVAVANIRVNLWCAAGHEAPAPRVEPVRRPTDIDTESPAWDFDASIDARDPAKCNISFIIKDPPPTWFTRPAYIYWTAGYQVIATDVVYPGRSPVQPIDVPPDASGLVTVTVLRVERNGQCTRRGRVVFVFPRARIIGVRVDCPGESRPGSQISIGIQVDPPHDRKQLEFGALLVDKAVRGRDVPLPFSQISMARKDMVYVQDSWSSRYSDLARELDRFIGGIIRNINQYACSDVFTASDVLHLVKLVKRSNFCGSDFIDHHVKSLRCNCGNQPPRAVLEFILDYLRDKHSEIDELAMELAWFPGVVGTWKYMITPGNPLVQELAEEFPGVLERVLAWSTDELRKQRRRSSPEDFKEACEAHLKDRTAAQELSAVLGDVERFIKERLEVALSAIHAGPRSPDVESGNLTYHQALGRLGQSVLRHVALPMPVDPESIICVDNLPDWSLSDQATSDVPRFAIPVVIGYPKYCSIMTDVGGGTPVPSPFGGGAGDRGPVVTVRTFFPDCGYWNPRVVVGDGKASVAFKLPDTITQQDFVVQATSMDCEVGTATKPIFVRQEFFIQPDIPPHLIYGDVVGINAIVTNRTAQDVAVDVSLDAEGFATTSAPPGQLHVGGNGAARVSWTVRATACGEKHLVFTAASPKYKDVVDQVIYVHPEGEPDVKITRGLIPAGESGFTRLVIDVAPGEVAHHARLSIIPDRSSMALDGIEAMLTYPHGCVEQTMSSVLPNLLVYEALKARGRLTQRYKETCEDLTSKGLQRLLSFRHADHGWGWWEKDDTNLFMTAYVLRGILKMKALGFYAPQDVIDDALSVIFGMRQADGSWLQGQAIRWDKVSSKDAMPLNETGMTAWILLCISETGDWRGCFTSEVEQSISFLGDALATVEGDPNALAVTGLAVRKLSPGNTCLERVQEHLEKLQEDAHWGCGSAIGGDVDATAKALHFLLLQPVEGCGLDVQACVGWILGQRAAHGGWGTTMATASVVEAVLAMKDEGGPAIDGEAVVNGHSKRVHVDESNIAEEFVNLRDMNMTTFLVPGKNDLDIRLASKRDVQYQLTEESWLKERFPGRNAFKIERIHSNKKARIGETITVSVKVTPVQGIDQCAVIEERIPAGFKLDVEAFDASMKDNPGFDYYTRGPEKLVLYPRSAGCAFTYSLIASRAFSGTHAGTEVYAMYSPDARGLAPPVSLDVRKD